MEGLIGCACGEDYLQVCCAPGRHLPHHHQDVSIVGAEVRAWDTAANDPSVSTITEKALVDVIVKTDGSFAALSWELHAERQLGVVDGELGQERQAVVLVRVVHQVQVGGGEGDVLAGGGHAGVKLVSGRNPGSVPPTH